MTHNKLYPFILKTSPRESKIHVVRYGEKRTLCGVTTNFSGVYDDIEVSKKWLLEPDPTNIICSKCKLNAKKELKITI